MAERDVNWVEVLRRFKSDFELLTGLRHRKQLNRNYSGKWVAAYDGRIVASAQTQEELADKVEEKGIPFGFVAMEMFPLPRYSRRSEARVQRR